MKAVSMIAVAVLILCIALPGSIQSKFKKPKTCIGKDGQKYEKGEYYEDKEACVLFTCVKKGKKTLVMKKVDIPCGSTLSPAVSRPKETTTTEVPETAVPQTKETTTTEVPETENPSSSPSLLVTPTSATTESHDNLVLKMTELEKTVQSIIAALDTKCDATTCSNNQALTTDLETCLGDVSSLDCPSSPSGKTGLAVALAGSSTCGTSEEIANIGETPVIFGEPMVFVEPMTMFAIATFVISQIQFFAGLVGGESSHGELMEKLNEIKDITISTQKSVNVLLIATDFLDQQILLTNAQTKILSHFNRMEELTRNKADKSLWDSWAAEVADGNSGTVASLNTISTQITYNNIIAKFKNKAAVTEKAGTLSRSVAGSIADFFMLQVICQLVGFETLQKAYKYRNQCQNRNFEYKVLIERFNNQVQQSQRVAASFADKTSYFRNDKWGTSYFSMHDVKYVNLKQVEADEGQVVTGVQLYILKNRIAMKIKQGTLQKFGNIANETWKDSAWGDHYMKVYDSAGHYVDLHTAKVPPGKAVVGISFYQKGNRVSVMVKPASVDYLSGKVSLTSEWIKADGWGDNYYSTKDYPYVDGWKVETMPSGMLTGVGLYRKGNRMAVHVSDVFEPFNDGLSCIPYNFVKMKGNYDCCHEFLYNRDNQTCPSNGNGPEYNCTASTSGQP